MGVILGMSSAVETFHPSGYIELVRAGAATPSISVPNPVGFDQKNL
jgi:hypothetical protein